MTLSDTKENSTSKLHVYCKKFDATLNFYTRELGFRIDMIFPADEPHTALLSGYGIEILLEQNGSGFTPSATSQKMPKIVQKAGDESEWKTGRAGMQYRDLIPGRMGGRYIASHIRIPKGGPVADYVHHHQIQFQMIYCYKGRVRVVYEDQGPPITMHPGDCVLQPPHIRHRVLESSDGMEVIEIAGPAEHETLVDHEMSLPTTSLKPQRDFDGQRFVFHQAADATLSTGIVKGFMHRDTGIFAATNGLASVLVLIPDGSVQSRTITNKSELLFHFVLHGKVELKVQGHRDQSLKPGDSFVIPENSSYLLTNKSADLELLQLTIPNSPEP